MWHREHTRDDLASDQRESAMEQQDRTQASRATVPDQSGLPRTVCAKELCLLPSACQLAASLQRSNACVSTHHFSEHPSSCADKQHAHCCAGAVACFTAAAATPKRFLASSEPLASLKREGFFYKKVKKQCRVGGKYRHYGEQHLATYHISM